MPIKFKSRRSFLKEASRAGVAATGFANFISIASVPGAIQDDKKDNITFLFQGDSITDGNRGRNTDPNHIMGHGYAFSIASRVGATFPKKGLTFYNRGVSGNKMSDLAARWQKDTIDLKPGVLSVLIGVNDVDLAIRNKQPVEVEKYAEIFRSILNQVKTQFPGCIFVLCEPFILPVGRVKENWDTWTEEMQRVQKVVYSLSTEYDSIYIPLQKAFDKASEDTAADYWIWDGIHPTVAGHEIVTREWLSQVSRRLHFLKKLI